MEDMDEEDGGESDGDEGMEPVEEKEGAEAKDAEMSEAAEAPPITFREYYACAQALPSGSGQTPTESHLQPFFR